MFTCSIDLNADCINTAHNNIIEWLLQFLLIDIVLILTNSDWFWINFNQFSQGIHQSSSDRYSTTNGNIIIRKFITGSFWSWINWCPCLTYYKYLYVTIKFYPFYEIFSLPACSTIANCNCLNFVGIHKWQNLLNRHSSLILWGVRIDCLIVNKISLSVKANNFAACSEPRV